MKEIIGTSNILIFPSYFTQLYKGGLLRPHKKAAYFGLLHGHAIHLKHLIFL